VQSDLDPDRELKGFGNKDDLKKAEEGELIGKLAAAMFLILLISALAVWLFS